MSLEKRMKEKARKAANTAANGERPSADKDNAADIEKDVGVLRLTMFQAALKARRVIEPEG